MPAIAAANVTVVIQSRVRTGKRKMHRGTITLGDGALTYSTTGIPLPAKGVFGFNRVMEGLDVLGNNARTTDYMYRYNKSAHALMLYEEEAAAAGGPLLECDTAEAPAARTLDFVAYGW